MDGDRAKDSDERGITFLPTSGSRAGGMMKEKTARITDAMTDLQLGIDGLRTQLPGANDGKRGPASSPLSAGPARCSCARPCWWTSTSAEPGCSTTAFWIRPAGGSTGYAGFRETSGGGSRLGSASRAAIWRSRSWTTIRTNQRRPIVSGRGRSRRSLPSSGSCRASGRTVDGGCRPPSPVVDLRLKGA